MPSPRLCRAGVLAAVGTLLFAASLSPARAAASAFGPLPPHNPYAGPDGTATMHGDTGSSDATPLPGPGTGPLTSKRIALQSACPTILVGSDGYPLALCTPIFTRVPTVHLLDPATGTSLAQLALTKGSPWAASTRTSTTRTGSSPSTETTPCCVSPTAKRRTGSGSCPSTAPCP